MGRCMFDKKSILERNNLKEACVHGIDVLLYPSLPGVHKHMLSALQLTYSSVFGIEFMHSTFLKNKLLNMKINSSKLQNKLLSDSRIITSIFNEYQYHVENTLHGTISPIRQIELEEREIYEYLNKAITVSTSNCKYHVDKIDSLLKECKTIPEDGHFKVMLRKARFRIISSAVKFNIILD